MRTYTKLFFSLLLGISPCLGSHAEDEENLLIQQWHKEALASEDDRQAALLWDRILYFSYPTDEEIRSAAAAYYRSDDYKKAATLYEKLVDVDQPSVNDCRNFLVYFSDFSWGQIKFKSQTLDLMPRVLEIIRKDIYNCELDDILIGKMERILAGRPENLADPDQQTLDFNRQVSIYSDQVSSNASLFSKKKAKFYYKLGKLQYNYALASDDRDETKTYLEEAKNSFEKVYLEKAQPYLDNIIIILQKLRP